VTETRREQGEARMVGQLAVNVKKGNKKGKEEKERENTKKME
jgi:hypothetical protein